MGRSQFLGRLARGLFVFGCLIQFRRLQPATSCINRGQISLENKFQVAEFQLRTFPRRAANNDGL